MDDQNEHGKFDLSTVPRAAILEEMAVRQWGAHCAELAAQLARLAGEEVQRPLSREQLARGFHANETETLHLLQMLDDTWRKHPPVK